MLEADSIDDRDLTFADLDANSDGMVGNGDSAVSFASNGDLVLTLTPYGATSPDSVTLRGVAFLHKRRRINPASSVGEVRLPARSGPCYTTGNVE